MLAEANFSANPVTDPDVNPALLVVFLVLVLVATELALAAELLPEVVVPCALEAVGACRATAERVVVFRRLVFLVVVVAVAF